MVQVFFIDGQPVPVDLSGVSSLSEVRFRVAEVLRAPSPDNVELLDEAGERMTDDLGFIANLGDMKIQTFVFGIPQPPPEGDEEDEVQEVEEERWPSPPISEDFTEEGAKLNELKLSAGGKNLEQLERETTRASSQQADSPSASFPLHEAVTLGDYDAVVQLLADGVNVGTRDTEGDTALHRAAYHSRQDIVKALLGAHADPNAPDRKGKTPLRRAYDSKDVAEALVSAGADPNVADKNGNTALHRAAEDDHVDVASVLLAASADPNLLNDDDLSPFHTSAIFGKVNVAKLLLGARADIHAKGCGGNTALHFAAYGGHEAVGKFLIESGADRDARNEDGETPLEHARTGDHEVPAWLLTE